jgi:hypothetical protein
MILGRFCAGRATKRGRADDLYSGLAENHGVERETIGRVWYCSQLGLNSSVNAPRHSVDIERGILLPAALEIPI